MKNYLIAIREKIGKSKIIHPGARIIIENDKNEFLIVERKDNKNIGVPAGSIEEDETIEDCIKREVKEETGLIIDELEIIGISSNPKNETVIYPNGDIVQYFTIEFYSNKWSGKIDNTINKEIDKAYFVNFEKLHLLPQNEKSIIDSYEYYKLTNKIKLK